MRGAQHIPREPSQVFGGALGINPAAVSRSSSNSSAEHAGASHGVVPQARWGGPLGRRCWWLSAPHPASRGAQQLLRVGSPGGPAGLGDTLRAAIHPGVPSQGSQARVPLHWHRHRVRDRSESGAARHGTAAGARCRDRAGHRDMGAAGPAGRRRAGLAAAGRGGAIGGGGKRRGCGAVGSTNGSGAEPGREGAGRGGSAVEPGPGPRRPGRALLSRVPAAAARARRAGCPRRTSSGWTRERCGSW